MNNITTVKFTVSACEQLTKTDPNKATAKMLQHRSGVSFLNVSAFLNESFK